jgi:maltooligosyltrehalose synthase
MSITTRIRQARTVLNNVQTQRREYRQLTAELAAFQTPAERAELDELIARHSPEETRQIRAILNRQDYQRARRATVLGGLGS